MSKHSGQPRLKIMIFQSIILTLLALQGSTRVKPTSADLILKAAKAQLVSPALYDPAYVQLKYPMGDVVADRGVCTDVVIRALRGAGYDLQKLIYVDMGKRFSAYPRRGRSRDPNIDHRRVPNQAAFFAKYGLTLPVSTAGPNLKTWHQGDIVRWKLDNGLDHIGIISDTKNRDGIPFVIHNMSQTSEEDCLLSWKIVAHYRFPK